MFDYICILVSSLNTLKRVSLNFVHYVPRNCEHVSNKRIQTMLNDDADTDADVAVFGTHTQQIIIARV